MIESEQPTIDDGLTAEQVEELESGRLEKLNEAGINEQEILAGAQEDLNLWNSYFNENVTRGKDDMNFVIRDQWTAIERSEFNRLFKPAMTFNKLYDKTKKVAGEQRKNKPDLLVRSLTGKASQEQIDLRADLVRSISYQSQNDLVYQTAFRAALMMGYGAFRIDIDYESPKSFNQIVKFHLITDPTRTTFDPSASKPHKGDGNFCSLSHIMGKEEFAATYPFIINPVPYTDPRTLLDFQWETRDTMVICDYYVKEWHSFMLYQLSNGDSVTEEEWELMQKQFKIQKELAKTSQVVGDLILKEIPTIKSSRQSQDYTIMHYRLIKDKVIDFTRWPSRQLPIIFVDGDSNYVDGKQYTKSFVHEARDAQKFINYVGSEVAAEIKNRRREQWIGTPDNIIGNEQMWRNPELQMGILIAKPDPKTGQMPTKMSPWDMSSQMLTQYQRGNQDIQEIMGFSEGQNLQGRDVSGVARRERKVEGSMSSYVFQDNLNQAIEQAGRVVLDLLPVIYGKDERHVVVSKADGKTKSVVLNKKNADGTVSNALEVGEYDIEIDTGPSFAVQKEIALEFFQQTIAANPQTFNLIADLWAKNLDIQFMPQVAERFKMLVPPEVLAKEAGEPPPPPKPNPQDQLMQMEMQEKMGKLKNDADEIKIKEQKLQLDKAELMLKAQKLQSESKLDVFNHEADIEEAKIRHQKDHHQTDVNYATQIAKILADLHKQDKQHAHEKSLHEAKPKHD
jgi:hypothetical protein